MGEATVIIVGAGVAGLATSVCLKKLNISNIVLEREDCYAAFCKKNSNDGLKLHLAKEFCKLPYKPFPPDTPRFVSKEGFIKYLDNYVSHFQIDPKYYRYVVSGYYDEKQGGWRIVAINTALDTHEVYFGKFLVVATGENSEGYIPHIPGLNRFEGELLHSSDCINGEDYKDKRVLVVGCGNSGMEIAYCLSNHGAKTSIVVRSPVHILTKEIVWLSMSLLRLRVPMKTVDKVAVKLGKLAHGDLSKYGIPRPQEGPFYLKAKTGQSTTIDVGCVKKIKRGQIKVFPSIINIKENNVVEFIDGDIGKFEAIIFATGYRSTVRKWLKDGGGHFGENGMPNKNFPNHWKGESGLYCAGFGRQGLLGISNDARRIAEDIAFALSQNNGNN